MDARELLPAIRNYLDITWEDAAGDEKLLGILSRGMDYLDRLAGEKLDYKEEKQPRALLLDYVRYVRADALHEFATNYLHELLSLQIEKEVERYAAEPTPDV